MAQLVRTRAALVARATPHRHFVVRTGIQAAVKCS